MQAHWLLKVILLYNFIFYVDDNSYGYKLGDNKIILTNKKNEDLQSIYPVSSNSEHLFRSIFNNKTGISPINQLNFLAKNFRFKCQNCSKLCGINFYIEKSSDNDFLKNAVIICEECYKGDSIIKSISKENLISASIYNVINPRESKYIYYNLSFRSFN